MNEKKEWAKILLDDLLKSANENTGNEPSISCFNRAFDELSSFVYRNLNDKWQEISFAPENIQILVKGNFKVGDTPDGDYFVKAIKSGGVFYAYDENGEIYEPGWLTHFTFLPENA